MISFNTAATGTADTSASVELAIPAGVLVADIGLMAVTCFTEDATEPVIAFSGAGGAWELLATTDSSANPQLSEGSSVFAWGFAYWREATSGDPGETLTVLETGSPAGTTWWAVAAGFWTGAGSAQPDVAGGIEGFGSGGLHVTCPSLDTTQAGDWPVTLGGGAPGTGASFAGTVPSGETQRAALVSDVGVGAGIWDTGGSAGPAGSPIGGGTLGTGSAGTAWITAFTVGLRPAGAAPAAAAAAVPLGRDEPLVTRWSPVPMPGQGVLWARA